MWNSPNQKVRRVANAKKVEREKGRVPVHFQRINAKLSTAGTEPSSSFNTDVRLVLNDLSEKGAGLYSPVPIHSSEIVTLELSSPLHIRLRGKIIWCQDFGVGSHILSSKSFSYRIGLEFVTETDDEKKSIKEFYDQVTKVVGLG